MKRRSFKSRRTFKRTARKVHRLNSIANTPRGGIRL